MSARSARIIGHFLVILGLAATVTVGTAGAQAEAAVGLGTADNFAVLAGQGVTNTGPTTVNGDLGTWPNPAITGAGLTVNGSMHAADAVAQQAQADTTIAYNDTAGRPATTVATELGGGGTDGQVLLPGVYDSSSGTFEITGTLTLDAQGDPDAVFIFQTESTLVTASSSVVRAVNGADACNVFWQVGSSATLGTASTFLGTILALQSITVTTGVTIEGRVLARNGAVTLDSDTITRASCTTPTTTGTTVTSSTNPSDSGEPVTFTATVTGDGGATPTGTVTFLDNGSPIGSSPVENSEATLTTTDLAPGEHPITAIYLGAPGFDNSTSQELTQVVIAPPQAPPPTDASTPAGPGPSTPTPSNTPPTLASPSTPPTLARTGAQPGVRHGGIVGLALIALGGPLALAGAARRRDHTASPR